jgi:predicted GNAT family acetyltransferase
MTCALSHDVREVDTIEHPCHNRHSTVLLRHRGLGIARCICNLAVLQAEKAGTHPRCGEDDRRQRPRSTCPWLATEAERTEGDLTVAAVIPPCLCGFQS